MCGPGVGERENAAWRTWHETEAEEVVPGVHRLELPLLQDGLKAVNVYAVESARGVTLVDAGWAFEHAEDLLAAGLHSAGLDLADVTDFLITHAHRDHYTLAVAVRRRLGSRIRVGLPERGQPRGDCRASAGARDRAGESAAFGRRVRTSGGRQAPRPLLGQERMGVPGRIHC